MNTAAGTIKQIIAYKIVRYNYNVKNDSGTLICAFNDKESAEAYKLTLLDKTKFEVQAYIYAVEPVYQYFDFMAFLGINK